MRTANQGIMFRRPLLLGFLYKEMQDKDFSLGGRFENRGGRHTAASLIYLQFSQPHRLRVFPITLEKVTNSLIEQLNERITYSQERFIRNTVNQMQDKLV